MHALHFQQNTGASSPRLINRNQSGDQLTHDQIRAVIRAWSASLDNQDVVAALVIEEWERQGGTGLDFPTELSRRRQKLFRWLDGETEYARENIRQLTPAILAVLPLEFRRRLTASLDACSDYLETDCVMDRLDISYEEAEKRTSGAIEFHDAIVAFVNQQREGTK
ncbi:toxin YdaT domain-containing protein [Klebsiella variicola]|uniref:toxin YdaT domain-containing protein n=1 Tax=Klebsiella variicola TaxID=244366 RepID=UPI002181C9D0|nr:toxin YdaT domain-containing protein [Klebsiella variicola]GKN58897.1 hypothetical protein NUKP86_09740 [Klebsiella variicola]HCI8815961.1 regulator [Klebsiella variicola]